MSGPGAWGDLNPPNLGEHRTIKNGSPILSDTPATIRGTWGEGSHPSRGWRCTLVPKPNSLLNLFELARVDQWLSFGHGCKHSTPNTNEPSVAHACMQQAGCACDRPRPSACLGGQAHQVAGLHFGGPALSLASASDPEISPGESKGLEGYLPTRNTPGIRRLMGGFNHKSLRA